MLKEKHCFRSTSQKCTKRNVNLQILPQETCKEGNIDLTRYPTTEGKVIAIRKCGSMYKDILSSIFLPCQTEQSEQRKPQQIGHNSLFVLSRERELPLCESFPSHANCKYVYFAVAPRTSAIKVQCYSDLYISYNSLRISKFEKMLSEKRLQCKS